MNNLEILIEKIRNGDEKKETLYSALADFIKAQQMRYTSFVSGCAIERGDLLSLIWLGIEKAIESYDSKKDAGFLTWATTCVRFCILTEIKKNKVNYFSLDVPTDEYGEISLLDTVEDPSAQEAFSLAEDKSDGKKALSALKTLPKDQQQIMILCGIKNKTLSQAAKELNITVTHAKHLRFLAVMKLKSILA